MKLIGVVGRKRNGKDTIADYLISKHNFQKYSFADPLKRGCMAMFGFTEDQVFGELKDEIDPLWGCKPRDVLQVMGTELCQYHIQEYIPAFKNIGRLIWVKRFEQWYKDKANCINQINELNISSHPDKLVPATLNVVLSDVRFIHEAETIKKLGGEVWKVVRPGMDVGDLHASEKELDEIQFTHLIENDSTLEDLYRKIDTLYN